MSVSTIAANERLERATVLVEMGELHEAEREVASVLDEQPELLAGLELLAKIKHMRGQLSSAIACWAQIHTHSPQYETAQLQLASFLHLAREPEKGAGEFLALGQYQMWRKPTVYIELESIFRLYLARRVDEALARCDQMAAKYQGGDRNLHKLGVLAKAWIAELSGDLSQACEILEGLGQERGYETDTDRIFALARVYEQIGDAEHLEKAVLICRYLERSFQTVYLQGRLATLYEALGRRDEAARYQSKFLEIFRRRMYRPTVEEVARVASRRHLPLPGLAALRSLPDPAPQDRARPSPRERAIQLALRGDRDGSRVLLERGQDTLDRLYLADLAWLDGRTDEAIGLYIECLRADPAEMRVLGWLLDQIGRLPASSTTSIVELLAAPGMADQALRHLDAVVRADPLRDELWRRLACLHRLQGRADEAARCEERAAALEKAARQKRLSVGRALAAAVYHFLGKPKGLIHEVWVERKPTEPGRGGYLEEILGSVTPEMTQAVRNTFLSVREYARAKFPHRTGDILDYAYTYKITKEDEPSSGLSAGLPTALALLSVFLNREIPQDVASSGVLISDSHDVLVTRPIAEADYKTRGAYNRNLRMLLLPRQNRDELLKSSRVPVAIVEELVRYVADLDEAVSLTFGEEIWVV